MPTSQKTHITSITKISQLFPLQKIYLFRDTQKTRMYRMGKMRSFFTFDEMVYTVTTLLKLL